MAGRDEPCREESHAEGSGYRKGWGKGPSEKAVRAF